MPGRGAPAPPPPPRGPPPKPPPPPPPPGPPRPPGRVPVPAPLRPPPGPPGPAGPRPPTGRGGMLLGLGRGPPGRGPPGRAPSVGPPGPGRPPKRGADGRGPPGAPGRAAVWPGPAGPASPDGPAGAGVPGWPGRGARGADPMPVAVELNGLLPGRGPGRGPPWREAGCAPEPPADGLPGVLAAVGAAAGPGRGPDGRAAGCVAAAAAGSVTSGCACGNGTGGRAAWPDLPVSAAGRSVAGSAGALGAGAAGAAGPGASRRAAGLAGSAAGAAGAAAPVAAAGPWPLPPAWPAAAAPARPAGRFSCALPAWAENASLSLRTTGASIVDDAERTNSPISWSLAITALLSTPNSFASSYTRTFATALPLLGPARPDQSAVRGSACSVRRQPLLFIAACSSVAHRNLSLLSPAVAAVRALCRATLSWQAGTGSRHRKISGQPAGTKRSRQAQRPREHPTALRPVKAPLAGMQVCTPARHPR